MDAGYKTPRVTFVEGNVLDDHFMPAEVLKQADVAFWNNFGGWWEQKQTTLEDGTIATLQDAVKQRLLTYMRPGATCRA